MNIKIKHIERAAYIWMYSAVVIFLLGFIKWFIAVPLTAGVVFGLIHAFRRQGDESIWLSAKTLVCGALIVLIWMMFCGQGGFFTQGMDWNGRNAQLADLVEHTWPVYYSDGSAFTYYIGHFLPSALFGKLFGIGGARAFLMFYTSLGVYIVWLLMVKILRAEGALKQLLALLLLVFFGNTEALRHIILNFISGVFHTDLNNAVRYGFTANFDLFAWAFNQTTCAFIVLALFFTDDSRLENYMLMGVPLILFSPFMMCTIIVVFICGVAKELSKKDYSSFFKRLFSIPNLSVLIAVVPIVLIYLSGNIFSEKPESLALSFVWYGGKWFAYIGFLLFEFLIIWALIFPRFKRNIYYYSVAGILAVLIFFKMGLYNDLVTRGSASALFVLMLCVGDYLFNETNISAHIVRKIIVFIMLLTVAVPHANSCLDMLKGMSDEVASGTYHKKWLTDFGTYERIWERDSGDDQKYNYFTFDAKNHFFYKYLARD
ncbi:MAG: hypothetical protein IJH37_04910 [Clostridia bacterium]|nr:hypothetical protein [Clostridia bacterium]